jgi:sugar lactone lactonase YvrE
MLSACTGKMSGAGGGGGAGGGSAGGGGGMMMGGGAGGGAQDGTPKTLDPAAMAQSAFRLPLDAALSPDGKTAYFIALDPNQNPSVFTVASSGGTPTVLASGDPLAAPFGIDVSTDGSQLVLADSSALDSAGLDHGCLFTLGATAAGTPAQISSTTGYQPRSVVIVQENNVDVAYFTGHDPSDAAPGVFKVALGGGAVSIVAKGTGFADPSGLAVAANGTVYVADSIATENGHAQLLKVTAGTVSVVIADMAVGYPAGVALSKDETAILVSALDPATQTDIVIHYDLTANTQSVFNTTISAFSESAGLKRARNVDTFVWADSHANGGGTVYIVNKQP